MHNQKYDFRICGLGNRGPEKSNKDGCKASGTGLTHSPPQYFVVLGHSYCPPLVSWELTHNWTQMPHVWFWIHQSSGILGLLTSSLVGWDEASEVPGWGTGRWHGARSASISHGAEPWVLVRVQGHIYPSRLFWRGGVQTWGHWDLPSTHVSGHKVLSPD